MRRLFPGLTPWATFSRPCQGSTARAGCPATGDLVAADGDGVIVVPIEHVECVLTQARRIANGDRAGRRKLFAAAGKPQDGTTAELP